MRLRRLREPRELFLKSEHDAAEWRLAIQVLIDAAEDRRRMLLAKLGVPHISTTTSSGSSTSSRNDRYILAVKDLTLGTLVLR
jgi:hypothetical protein